MKVIENRDCRVIAVTMQGIVIAEYSGVIMQIDQQVILRAAEELGLLNYNVVHEPDEVEKLRTQLESALATCGKANKTIKEKGITIRNLTKDIDSGNKLIEELIFQRDSAKDSVVQLERQLEEQIAKTNTVTLNRDSYKTYINKLEDKVESLEAEIKEKQDIIKNLGKELRNYRDTGTYILRYVITDGNIIIDNAREHEPIVCADPETAATALRNLCNGTDYAAVSKCCDTSRYALSSDVNRYVISCLDSHDNIEINNRAIACNLYNLLRLGSISMNDVRKLIGEKK